MTLHIVNRSPFQHSALRECLEVITEADTLVLIEDGTYAASKSFSEGRKLEQVMASGRAYALREDLRARGIENQAQAKVIDMDEFVALCTQYNPIQSWF